MRIVPTRPCRPQFFSKPKTALAAQLQEKRRQNNWTVRTLWDKIREIDPKLAQFTLWSWLYSGVIPQKERGIRILTALGIPPRKANEILSKPKQVPPLTSSRDEFHLSLSDAGSEQKTAFTKLFNRLRQQNLLVPRGLQYQAGKEGLDISQSTIRSWLYGEEMPRDTPHIRNFLIKLGASPDELDKIWSSPQR